MKKIVKIPDEWGQDVIHVAECDKYEYEYQPDMVYLNKTEKYKKSIHNVDNFKNKRLNDILYVVENYFNNSGK